MSHGTDFFFCCCCCLKAAVKRFDSGWCDVCHRDLQGPVFGVCEEQVWVWNSGCLSALGGERSHTSPCQNTLTSSVFVWSSRLSPRVRSCCCLTPCRVNWRKRSADWRKTDTASTSLQVQLTLFSRCPEWWVFVPKLYIYIYKKTKVSLNIRQKRKRKNNPLRRNWGMNYCREK